MWPTLRFVKEIAFKTVEIFCHIAAQVYEIEKNSELWDCGESNEASFAKFWKQ